MYIMRRRILLLAVLCGLCVMVARVGAAVQTHPCDQPSATNQVISSGASYKVQVCASASDQSEAATVFINGIASDLRAIAPITAPSATGHILYEVSLGQFAKGNYVIEVALWNRPFSGGPVQQGVKSAPFSFGVEDDLPPPSAPVIKGVIKG